eukprot:m.276936 g.276936  ORF g.276936 m.276936 type:complete len:283 (+) comp19776_c0_seq1:272-1120(+)
MDPTIAKKIWASCDAVCFDVDSTVCEDEAIDRLAAHIGVGEAVAAWTAKAMGGGVGYRESLAARLEIMKPSLQAVQACLAAEPPRLTTGVVDLVSALVARGKKVCTYVFNVTRLFPKQDEAMAYDPPILFFFFLRLECKQNAVIAYTAVIPTVDVFVQVYLVTGGFHRLVVPVGAALGLPEENIFANRLMFHDDGSYAGFDESCPTSATGGKPKVVSLLKQRADHGTIAMIGDGATDMEARPPADIFIGFGGNAVRQKVKDGADWFVHDFQTLEDALHDGAN